MRKLIYVPNNLLQKIEDGVIKLCVDNLTEGKIAISTRIDNKPVIIHGEIYKRFYPTIDGLNYEYILQT